MASDVDWYYIGTEARTIRREKMHEGVVYVGDVHTGLCLIEACFNYRPYQWRAVAPWGEVVACDFLYRDEDGHWSVYECFRTKLDAALNDFLMKCCVEDVPRYERDGEKIT